MLSSERGQVLQIQLQKLLPLVCLVIRVEDRLVKGGCCACSVLPLIV